MEGVTYMFIRELLNKKETTVSLEIFPPKEECGIESLFRTADTLSAMKPDFMSVTYGAGGGTSRNTLKIASHIQNDNGITALAHLTCLSSTKDEIRTIMRELKEAGIKNVLALRGDLPEDAPTPPYHYHHAYELMEELAKEGGFCIGGACYPEGHPENPSIIKDMDYLKLKADAGCEFLITQLYFDNEILYSFLNMLERRNISIPVIAGLMPVQNAKQIAKMCKLSGATITPKFQKMLDRYADNPEALAQAGLAYVTDQIVDLYANKVRGLHIYTMNKPQVAETILKNISSMRE